MANQFNTEVAELRKLIDELQKKSSIMYRGKFISVFVLVEHLLDVIISINISDNQDEERSSLMMAIMDFVKIDNKITILDYIMNKSYVEDLKKDYSFKYLKNEHGKNDLITALRKANEIRNLFSHHVIAEPDEDQLVSLPFKINMLKRTGLRTNKNNMTEIVEFRSSKSFSLEELEEYSKELITLTYVLIKISGERMLNKL